MYSCFSLIKELNHNINVACIFVQVSVGFIDIVITIVILFHVIVYYKLSSNIEVLSTGIKLICFACLSKIQFLNSGF